MKRPKRPVKSTGLRPMWSDRRDHCKTVTASAAKNRETYMVLRQRYWARRQLQEVLLLLTQKRIQPCVRPLRLRPIHLWAKVIISPLSWLKAVYLYTWLINGMMHCDVIGSANNSSSKTDNWSRGRGVGFSTVLVGKRAVCSPAIMVFSMSTSHADMLVRL